MYIFCTVLSRSVRLGGVLRIHEDLESDRA